MLPRMAEIPSAEPTAVTAGDTIRWKRSLSDYPASSGWTLKYRLINSAKKIDIASIASGSEHLVEISAAISAFWTPGDYDWQAYVEKAAERFTIAMGRITIKPDLAAQLTGIDTRSYSRQVLEAVQAALYGRASNAQLELEIAGRRIKYIPIEELLAFHDRFKAEVAKEESAAKIANGGGTMGRMTVRFANPL